MKKDTLKFVLLLIAISFSTRFFGQAPASNTSIISGAVANQNVSAEIYPNPNNGEFSLKLGSFSDKAFVTIYNSVGQLILKEKVTASSEHNINLKTAATGNYNLIVFDNNQPVYRTKFIKN